MPLADAQPPAEEDQELARLMKEFTSVYHAIEENYADPVDPQRAFYGGAIPGLLRSLDPFSAFLDPDQFQSLKDMQQSVQKGFGSVVSIGPGRVIVLQTLPGTPSARAGLSAGDEIVEINGYRLDRLELEQLVELLRESRQRQAQLLVRRPGVATLMTFTLTPAELASPSVSRAFFLKPGVGYVKVESFDENTGEELHKAIDKLGGAKLRGLVLDLRDNPGGVLPAAIEVAAMFLKPGQLILTVRGRPRPEGEKQSAPKEEVKVPEDAKPFTFPLGVLINGKSASASEIVAGALQDHDRATIVGQPSFGKGLVQQVFDLSESTGLALTTALYFTPSGRSIQRPLDQLKNPNGDPQAAALHHTDAGREVKGGGGITPDVMAAPEPLTPFRAALEASSSFLTFAQRYTSEHRSIPADFEVTPALLDDFQLFLSGRQIRPSLSEWSANRDYIQNRLHTEISNLAFGVDKGDEVEAQRDAQVQAALHALELR
ncbi:MAG TPA: S41 family peptidase [Bryobacterales bacterium]|nr:S41 family peptidase [Bryobacterales bacterium]